MDKSINGIYAAFLTGSAGEGLAMLVLRNGVIVGADVGGAKYDGAYREATGGFAIQVKITTPPNWPLIQGGRTGPEGDVSDLSILLPENFLSLPLLRIEAKHGPVNAKFTKIRSLDD